MPKSVAIVVLQPAESIYLLLRIYLCPAWEYRADRGVKRFEAFVSLLYTCDRGIRTSQLVREEQYARILQLFHITPQDTDYPVHETPDGIRRIYLPRHYHPVAVQILNLLNETHDTGTVKYTDATRRQKWREAIAIIRHSLHYASLANRREYDRWME
jgi:hypothetical protein